jgi:hypothetical protein
MKSVNNALSCITAAVKTRINGNKYLCFMIAKAKSIYKIASTIQNYLTYAIVAQTLQNMLDYLRNRYKNK